ncbi:MAG: DNA repair protein RecN [Desulfobacteraceae bacterium]|nr:DNA repair protein RecN [Desulfobacteraceae bacterium]
MLQELTIRNFAIIEDLCIQLDTGLTILSGETGAGKSIIINAVNLLLGSRASTDIVRTGSENAELEAFFYIDQASAVAALMEQHDYDWSEGLLIRRIISAKGRHRIYINGRLATIQVLNAITGRLASISGQHAHQGLLKEEEHLKVLDQMGELGGLLNEYRRCYQLILPLIQQEEELLRKQSNLKNHLDLLRFQKNEILQACVMIGEDEQLEKERLRFKNIEFIVQTVRQCADELYSKDGAVVECMGRMHKDLEKAAGMDEDLAATAGEMADLTYKVEDLASTLTNYLSHADINPGLLENIEDRLDLLNKLKRKYGGTLEAVMDHLANIELQFQDVDFLDDKLAAVQADLKKHHTRLCHLGDELSRRRKAVAQKMAQQVEKELTSLKMADTRFAVTLESLEAQRGVSKFLSNNGRVLTQTGSDRAFFIIAPNVGEAMKPLTNIASGGELSRIVLALKAILSKNTSVETVVFDEVDSGIGGGVAEVVGKKIQALSRRHQILCITHLPQIAKYGEHHFKIVKSVRKGRTKTTISPLKPQERIEELARMLGGEKITGTTRAHARELLKNQT